MNYLKKRNIDEAIRQNLRKKDLYESDMHKIYNTIVDQTNEQLQEKAVKTEQDPIGYLMILKSLCLSNQSELNPISSLCLSTRHLCNTMQYANDNTTDYLVRFRNA